jgi:hypothetical protein
MAHLNPSPSSTPAFAIISQACFDKLCAWEDKLIQGFGVKAGLLQPVGLSQLPLLSEDRFSLELTLTERCLLA